MKSFISFLLATIMLLLIPTQAYAVGPVQRQLLSIGIDYYNTEDSLCIPKSSATGLVAAPNSSKVYVLGDSITVQMRDNGELGSKLAAKNWPTTKINAVGGKDLKWGAEQVTADASVIASSDSILVGLGTNNIGDVVTGTDSSVVAGGKDMVKGYVKKIIDNIKTANPNIKIYWTTVYLVGFMETSYGRFNMDIGGTEINTAIREVATETGVTIIPYDQSPEAKQIIQAKGATSSSDGIHPYGQLAKDMATYIANTITSIAPSSGGVTSTIASGGGGCSCSVTGTATSTKLKKRAGGGTKVYILGDSVTVLAEAKYREKLGSDVDAFINASVGRSWSGGGMSSQQKTAEGSYKPAKDAVQDDKLEVAAADGIIVALGTNGGLQSNPIDEVLSSIRLINPNAPIWWVNTGVSRTGLTSLGPFNSALASNTQIKDFVVNWAKTMSGQDDVSKIPAIDVNGYMDSDELHPNAAGIDALTSLSINTILSDAGGTQSGTSSGCAPGASGTSCTELVGATNEEKVWAYMTGKGMKPHMVAAFMGNMQAEAHFEPRLTEYAFSDPPHLSDTVPGDVNEKGQPGYGIIQWTAPGRKQGLRDIAAAQGKSTGDLCLQLDYMWQELNGGYKDTLDFVLASTDVAPATEYITRHYEIPSGIPAAIIKRTAFARDFIIKYGGGA